MVKATKGDKQYLALAQTSAEINKEITTMKITKASRIHGSLSFNYLATPITAYIDLLNDAGTGYPASANIIYKVIHNKSEETTIPFSFLGGLKEFGTIVEFAQEEKAEKDAKHLFIEGLAVNDSLLGENTSYKRVYSPEGSGERAKDLFNSPHMTTLVGVQKQVIDWFVASEDKEYTEKEFIKQLQLFLQTLPSDLVMTQYQLKLLVNVGYAPHFLVEITYRLLWSLYMTFKEKQLLDIL